MKLTAFGSGLLGLAMLAGPAAAQTTIATNASTSNRFSSNAAFVPGQSFLVTGTSQYNNIVFSFQTAAGANTGAGTLYLLNTTYTGTPAALSSSTAGFLGSALYSGGTYTFGSGVQLTGGTTYHVYSDTAQSVGATQFDRYSGGVEEYATSATSNFNGGATTSFDTLFTVTGTAVAAGAAPEPASWALMILGFGMAGTALRRRRRLGPDDRVNAFAA